MKRVLTLFMLFVAAGVSAASAVLPTPVAASTAPEPGPPVATVTGQPGPAAHDIIGGDPIRAGLTRCTIGFSVSGGFITGGHCGPAGTPVSTPGGTPIGVIQSVHPSRDASYVRVNPDWTPQPYVRGPNGLIPVLGGRETPVGTPVCRYSTIDSWQCGRVLAKNTAVTYPGGTVFGLTRVSICAPIDHHGGPWLANQQAQGVTSGWSGNCAAGGAAYFTPLTPILSAFGLTLLVAPPAG